VTPDDGSVTGEWGDHASLEKLVREALGSLRARDGDVALNAERLKTVVDTAPRGSRNN